MKVFLDTNVIIDFYNRREEFFRPAALIMDLALRKEIELAVSSLSFVTAFYLFVQYESAQQIRPDVIVTRNVKDYRGFGGKVQSPVEFLDDYFASAKP